MRIVRREISERLLPYVEHPAQYTGLEHNRRCRDVTEAEVTALLAFPDAYEVGISHLGTQILYTAANAVAGVACDRTYCPPPDAERRMRAEGLPLFGWESRAAAGDFDLVGFSLSYEMVVTNMLTMLDLAGVPLHADARREGDPIILVGGTQADAPEAMADFTDIFLVGDGEQSLIELIEIIRRAKRSGAPREDILLEAARTIPSAYVPSLWRPTYGADGGLTSLKPVRDDLPTTITRGHVPLSASPAITHPLVPPTRGVFDRISIEIMRGCPHNCRFCHAGATKTPLRWRSVEEILETADASIASTGFREISLLSLSTGDYPHLGELIDRMNERFGPRHISIAVPSLRVDKQLAHLPWQLNKVRKGGMTIAAEVGTDVLRRAIRKRVTNEDLLAGVTAAYAAGWKSVKVYFMAGFPGETTEDLEGIVALCKRMAAARKGVDGHKGAVTASVSWFVPKPHTAMQWASRPSMEYYWYVRDFLSERSRRSPVTFKFHHIERSTLEAAVARGDRRMGRVVEAAWRGGARFDGWREHFDFAIWLRAFEQAGVDLDTFASRQRATDELLPWDHILGPRRRSSLADEWEQYRRIVAER